MRVMVIVKANKESESGAPPDEKVLAEMGKLNAEMVKAGVLLLAEGLHPSSEGKRVKFAGGKLTVLDGPFSETKELIAGFTLLQVKSMDEAVEWVKRAPFPEGEVELRRVFEAEELFPTDSPRQLRKKELESRQFRGSGNS